MARVTVEDCAEVVQNRFELVALASQRAKSICSGAAITIERDNDKNTVVALREIADRTVSAEQLKETLVTNCQERGKTDSYEEDTTTESEARAEMASLQGQGQAAADDDLLYGDNVADVED